MTGDVVVVGGGIVGATTTLALARRGARVTLIATANAGEASFAAAGMLAPSVERVARSSLTDVDRFALAARDRYPELLADLRQRSGIDVPCNRLGILEVAPNAAAAERLRAAVATSGSAIAAEWLDPGALAALEPALGHTAGGVRFAEDGAVETRTLLRALAIAIAREAQIVRVDGAVRRLQFERDQVICHTVAGVQYSAASVVLAAGAWTPRIAGLPRPLPVIPVRGQIVAFAPPAAGFARLRHVTYGPGGYLVPRDSGQVLAGSTMEDAGFDASTTESARSTLVAMATALCPALAGASVADTWAGIRPVTPDLAPIIGFDPDRPNLVYACGHSRNGILLAPLTGDCVAALVTGADSPVDIAPFSVTRFTAATG